MNIIQHPQKIWGATIFRSVEFHRSLAGYQAEHPSAGANSRRANGAPGFWEIPELNGGSNGKIIVPNGGSTTQKAPDEQRLG